MEASGPVARMTIIVVASLGILSVLLALSARSWYVSDMNDYVAMADRWRSGLRMESGAYRSPMYPLFLGLLGKLRIGHPGIKIVQVLIYVTICLALDGAVASRIQCVSRGTLGVVAASSLPSAQYAATFLSEAIAIPLLAGILAVTAAGWERFSGRRAALLGVLWGLLVLARPPMLSSAFGFLIWMGLPQSPVGKLRTVPALVLGFLLALSPWVYRNYCTVGGFVPLTTSTGVNLYLGNNPAARSDGGGSEASATGLWAIADETVRSRVAVREALSFMSQHPLRTVGMMGRRALKMLSPLPGQVETVYFGGSGRQVAIAYIVVYALSFALLMLLATIGWWGGGLEPRWRSLILAMAVPYAISLAVTFVQARFVAMFAPLLFIPAAAGVGALCQCVREADKTRAMLQRRGAWCIMLVTIAGAADVFQRGALLAEKLGR